MPTEIEFGDYDEAAAAETVETGVDEIMESFLPAGYGLGSDSGSSATLATDSFEIATGADLDQAQADSAGPRETPCSFICGPAGAGKSYTLRQRLEEDQLYAILAASTGISAINLNTVTIHSLLGFFDTNSLRDAYLSGAAQRKLRRIAAEGYKNVVVDEVSMISKDTLDLLVRIFDDVNLNQKAEPGQPLRPPIGLIVCGDVAQLPSIPENQPRKIPGKRSPRTPTPWCFESQTWSRFEQNITKLTKIWRQGDARFLAALNYARIGQGREAAGILESAGVTFYSSVDLNFDGTTILSKNIEVDRFNMLALDKVQGRRIGLPSRRWGQQRSEWKNIPEGMTEVKEGAYVMILANKYDYAAPGAQPEMIYANGDCGHVKGIEASTVPGEPPRLYVELVRNGQTVTVTPVIRAVETGDKVDGLSYVTLEKAEDGGQWLAKPHYRSKAKKYVSGQIQYFPIRLAFASTCHKCQGLTLDRCQIDFRDWMMKMPGMAYTALSRCRSLEGLRLVGSKDQFAAACVVDPKVRRWL